MVATAPPTKALRLRRRLVWHEGIMGCLDGDGNLFVVDEHAARKWLPDRHAAAVKAMLARHRLALPRLRRFAGRSRWQLPLGDGVLAVTLSSPPPYNEAKHIMPHLLPGLEAWGSMPTLSRPPEPAAPGTRRRQRFAFRPPALALDSSIWQEYAFSAGSRVAIASTSSPRGCSGTLVCTSRSSGLALDFRPRTDTWTR